MAIVGLIFGAVTDAALLGILHQPDQTGWRLMWSSVRDYTWVLFRLIMLIGIIALAAMIPFLFLIRLLQWVPLIGFAIAFVYVVLIKYALAFPLVVEEKLNAWPALKRSWEMTRGHFWYVLFCYLLMAAAHVTVNELFARPWLDASVLGSLTFFLKHAADGFFDSLWIILGWQMYQERSRPRTSPLPKSARHARTQATPTGLNLSARVGAPAPTLGSHLKRSQTLKGLNQPCAGGCMIQPFQGWDCIWNKPRVGARGLAPTLG
jgi:hypothetical protein